MLENNDNLKPKEGIRSKYRTLWPSAGCQIFTSDDGLKRLADARNASSRSANRFLAMSIVFSFLYFVKLADVAEDVSLGSYRIRDIPFGLFVFASSALLFSCASFARYGDSRVFDRQLRFSSDKRDGGGSEFAYLSFPNENAWGSPFGRALGELKMPTIPSCIRTILLLFITLLHMALLCFPIIVGLLYIRTHYKLEIGLSDFRYLSVLLLMIMSTVLFLLLTWVTMADRD